MFFTITEEMLIFLYACLTGALIMLFHDILSVTQRKNCPLLIINLCDGIFIAVACVLMIVINLSISNGIVRAYEFVGVFLGAVLYKLLFSRLICFLLRKIIAGFTSFFKVFFKILLTPLNFMYKIINKCILAFMCPIACMFKRFRSYVLFRTQASVRTIRKVVKKT
jgi:hypothetical protein